MMRYLWLVKQTMDRFPSVKMVQVARGQNRHIDFLATLASSSTKGIPQLITVELVAEPSISAGAGVSQVAMVEPCWMDPIIKFLAEDHFSDDEKEAEKVHQTTAWYWLSVDHKLYRRSFGRLYLQCQHPSKVGELLDELHDGACGSHLGGRSLAHWALTQGFWWPQMQKDANEYA